MNGQGNASSQPWWRINKAQVKKENPGHERSARNAGENKDAGAGLDDEDNGIGLHDTPIPLGVDASRHWDRNISGKRWSPTMVAHVKRLLVAVYRFTYSTIAAMEIPRRTQQGWTSLCRVAVSTARILGHALAVTAHGIVQISGRTTRTIVQAIRRMGEQMGRTIHYLSAKTVQKNTAVMTVLSVWTKAQMQNFKNLKVKKVKTAPTQPPQNMPQSPLDHTPPPQHAPRTVKTVQAAPHRIAENSPKILAPISPSDYPASYPLTDSKAQEPPQESCDEPTEESAGAGICDLPLLQTLANPAYHANRIAQASVDVPNPVPPPAPIRPTSHHAPPIPKTGASPSTALIAAAIVAICLGLAMSFYAGKIIGGQMTQAKVETITRDYILTHPDIVPQALERHQFKLASDQIAALRTDLETPFSGAWIGNARGDVTVVIFTDYACVFCRESLSDVDRLTRENHNVKVVFRELPIISPYSRDAAMAALIAARQSKYYAFHRTMFASGVLDRDTIAAASARAGVVDDKNADATLSRQTLEEEIHKNITLAQKLALDGTPSWIIGDRLLTGAVGYEALKQAIEDAQKL